MTGAPGALRQRAKLRLPVAALALVLSVPATGQAQTVPSADPGWRFAITPYAWVPGVDAQLRYGLPGSGGNARVNVDSFNVLEALNFAAMLAAEARNGRFTLIGDFIYLNLGNSSSVLRSVEFTPPGFGPVTANLSGQAQSSVYGGLGTLAGGYTLADGAWGHVDAQLGFRILSLTATTQLRLGADIAGPGPGLSLSRGARFSRSETVLDGIVGLRGRFVLGAGFHLPYAVDIGAGGSQLTWQALGGIGYQTGAWGVAAGYRYLSYRQGSDALVRDLSFGGPFLALNYTF